MTYAEWVEDEAAKIGSDGTTLGSGLYVWCSKEHDVLYYYGAHRDGTPCGKECADLRFRACIQRHSPIGWWSPVAWYRWLAVMWFGRTRAQSKGYNLPVYGAQQRRIEIMREILSAKPL